MYVLGRDVHGRFAAECDCRIAAGLERADDIGVAGVGEAGGRSRLSCHGDMDIGGVLVSLIGDLDHDSKLLAWLDGCVAVPVVEDNLLNLNVRIPVILGGHTD